MVNFQGKFNLLKSWLHGPASAGQKGNGKFQSWGLDHGNFPFSFRLGLSVRGLRKSDKEVKHYKRRKRWLG
jgi:hypothetical protein